MEQLRRTGELSIRLSLWAETLKRTPVLEQYNSDGQTIREFYNGIKNYLKNNYTNLKLQSIAPIYNTFITDNKVLSGIILN